MDVYKELIEVIVEMKRSQGRSGQEGVSRWGGGGQGGCVHTKN